MPFRTVLGSIGTDISVIASGDPEWMRAGVTIDWSLPTAVTGSDLTLIGGDVVKVGQKYLRFGQVMSRILNPSVQTLAVTGTPTGGTFRITGTRRDTGAVVSQTIAYNATVAAVQTALDAIFGTGNILVAGAGALPGNTLTLTAQNTLTYVTVPALVADATGLTGGTTPGVTITVTNAGTNTGLFGPFDPAATDGRQTLSRGNVGILHRTVISGGAFGFGSQDTDHVGLLVGGNLIKQRVLQAGTGTASLAAGPTLAALEAALPRVTWVTN
jgi:hypothetical protein